MGNCCGSGGNDDQTKDQSGQALKQEEKKEEQKQGFQVRSFAVMRLTHEAIRYHISGLQEGLSDISSLSDEDYENLKIRWTGLTRCIDLHAKQENEGFFPILAKMVEEKHDEKGLAKFDANNETSFWQQHNTDDHEREAITQAFNENDKQKTKQAFDTWIADHLPHLKDEEGVMMPLTKHTADTVEGRGAVVRSILSVDRNEYSVFQFAFVLTALFKRGKEMISKAKKENDGNIPDEIKKKSKGPVKMYCLAAQMASNKEEWNAIKGQIKDIVDEPTYQMLVKAGIEQDGKQQ